MGKWLFHFLIVGKLINILCKNIKKKNIFSRYCRVLVILIRKFHFYNFCVFLHELAFFSSSICIVCIAYNMNSYSTIFWEFDNEKLLVKRPPIMSLWDVFKRCLKRFFPLLMGLQKVFWDKTILRWKYPDLIMHTYTCTHTYTHTCFAPVNL